MPSFRDNKDREWEVAIDAFSIMRIREDCDKQFMLNDFEDIKNNTYSRLQADPVLLCRVVYLLCLEQIKDREISERDFYHDVIGNAIDSATEAMLEAIINFTPRQKREVLKAMAEQEKVRAQATDKLLAMITDPKVREDIAAKIEQETDQQVNKLMELWSVSSAPASSA